MKARNIFMLSLAILFAFVVSNIICFFYSDLPQIHFRNTNATEAIYKPNTTIQWLTEGFGVNNVDNNGYVNPDKQLQDDNYVLILGSSHTQGKEVNQNEKYTTILNDILANDDDKLCVYNMGWDGHSFTRLVSGISSAISEFPNASAIVLEVGVDNFTSEQLKQALTNVREYSLLDTSTEILWNRKYGQMIKRYIPLTYVMRTKLLDDIHKQFNPTQLPVSYEKINGKKEVDSKMGVDEESMKQLIDYLRKIYDGKIILCYHPNVTLDENSSLKITDSNQKEFLKKMFSESGDQFIWVDTTERMIQKYNDDHVLPYGFQNTSFGSGHLNKVGHKILAEELYPVLEEIIK